MERYQGPDLAEHMSEQPGGRLPEADARRFFCHALAGLRHAHARGFLHSDVKPANIRLDETRSTAVLVDWGLAVQLSAQPLQITQGSPAYASPEQLTGHSPEHAWGRAQLSAAADLWSLGVTLHEMIAGTPPFTGSDFAQVCVTAVQPLCNRCVTAV